MPLCINKNLLLFFVVAVTDSEEKINTTPAPKKLKIRKAIISDELDDSIMQAPISSSASLINSLRQSNKDHLETKKQVENLRQKHGDAWLLTHGMKLNPNSGEESVVEPLDFARSEIDQLLKEPVPENRADSSTPINDHQEALNLKESPISVTVT